jgi:hypothetical protein
VHNLINGKVTGASPLGSVKIGRRRVVRASTLSLWIETNETFPPDSPHPNRARKDVTR